MNHDQSGQKYIQPGKDIVMENLRMHCVYQEHAQKDSVKGFFNYIKRVHQLCVDRISQECHEKAMTSMMGLSFNRVSKENVNQCIADSFIKSGS